MRTKLQAAKALAAAIVRAAVPYEAFVKGLGVMVDEQTCYVPDALVTCGSLDKTIKLADYFRIPSLRHYLIVDLTRRHVVPYSRRPDGVATVAVAREGDLTLDPPGLSVEVTSLFV